MQIRTIGALVVVVTLAQAAFAANENWQEREGSTRIEGKPIQLAQAADPTLTPDGENIVIDPLYDKVPQPDKTPPIINAQSPGQVETALGAPTALVQFNISAYDNVDGNVPYEILWNGQSISNPYEFPVGVHGVEIFATDKARNTASAALEFVVNGFTQPPWEDRTPPILQIPAPIEETVPDGVASKEIGIRATAQDETDGAIEPTYEIAGKRAPMPYNFPIGATEVLVSATDKSGNRVSTTLMVRVIKSPSTNGGNGGAIENNKFPSIQISKRIEETVAATKQRIDLQGRAFDGNKNSLPITYSLVDGSEISAVHDFPIGTTKVIASATDSNGKTVREEIEVVVHSNTPVVKETPWQETEIFERRFERSMANPEEWLIPGRYEILLNRNVLMAQFGENPLRDPRAIETALGLSPHQIIDIVAGDVPTLIVSGTPELIEKLKSQTLVENVGQDFIVSVFSYESESATQSAVLDWLDGQGTELDQKILRQEETRDVRVYVVDTGIREDHAVFVGKVDGWRGVAEGTGGPRENNCNRHGTAMASLIGGEGYGVAKRARFIDVNVAPCGDAVAPNTAMKFPASYITKALSWIVEQEKRRQKSGDRTPAVINLSLGAPAGWADKDSDAFSNARGIEREIQILVSDYNAIVVAAAGNSSMDACLIVPAYMPEVVTVGAVNLDNQMLKFSNFGACLNTVALGENQVTANSAGPEKVYRDQGTSGAAAIVSGVAAHLLATGQDRNTVMNQIVTMERKIKSISDVMAYVKNLPPTKNQQETAQTASYQPVQLAVSNLCLVNSPDGTVSMRALPNYQSEKYGALKNGDFVEIFGQDGRWLKVKTPDGRDAWSAAKAGIGQLLYTPDGTSPCVYSDN